MPKVWILNCRVTLEGAIMYAEAETKEEAIEKSKKDWLDIEYNGASLVDWEADISSLEENK